MVVLGGGGGGGWRCVQCGLVGDKFLAGGLGGRGEGWGEGGGGGVGERTG